MNNELLTEREAAPRLGWSEAALKLNRRKGRGPAYYRVGRKVLYRPCDLESFPEQNRFDHGSSPRDNNRQRDHSRG